MQPEEISIGIICPLPIEVAAMVQMLDERYSTQKFQPDPNPYHLGCIGEHNIVIAGLPDGLTGITSATIVAERLCATFPSLKALLLVGIGGGAYTVKNDIRLGDVVVSRPDGKYGGVVQYDFGKSLSEGRFEHTGALNSPPRELLLTLAAVRANHLANGTRLPDYLTYLEDSQSNPNLKYPGAENDILFDADYDHAGGSDCTRCDKAREIRRKPRKVDGPVIHYGTIASANQLMRDSTRRDLYNKDYDNRILCFEMEAAGLLNNAPCLVIRGISDYADSHKREDHVWHGYAAAAAAAFAKEFIKTTPGGSLKNMLTVGETLAIEDTPKALWLVPFQRNTNFIGRESQLNDLGTKLSSDVQCQRVAVVGLGGVGKTQLVLEFAYRRREISPACAIFWIPAVNSATFEQAYLQIGHLLQIQGITEKNTDVKQLVKEKLSQESSGQWLLILDNADDIDVLYKRAHGDNGSLALIDYLPSSRYGSIIFTTRTRKAAVKQAGSNMIKVYEMGQAEAKKVLEKSLVQTHILEDGGATTKLLNLLSCLPLAIIQAAAFINANEISISSYLALYESGEDEVIELLSEDFEDQGRYRDKDVKNPIATTWLISFNQISQQDRLAADYLSFMSCVVPQRIPESLLPPAQSKLKMTAAIGTLTAYSFISKRETEQSFDLHRLVHLATRNWLKRTQSLAAWTEKALSRLADVFPHGDHKDRAVWRVYLPHARQILVSPYLSDRTGGAKKSLLLCVGFCSQRDGQYIEAEHMYQQASELSKQLLGPGHPGTLLSMNQLGIALSRQGKYFEAEKLHRQTIELSKTISGLEHKSTLSYMHELGAVLCSQGKYFEAEQLHQQVLGLRKKVLGPEHPNTLSSIHALGVVLNDQGKYFEAEKVLQQVLKLDMVSGPEHPDTLASMHVLGVVLSNQGKYVEAEQLYWQVLELRKKVLGPEHPHTLSSMHELGVVLNDQGKYVEAEQILKQTLELRKKVSGLEHPHTLVSMHSLGVILRGQGGYVEAEQILKQTLELRKKVSGLEHPHMLTSMRELGVVLRLQGNYVEAEQLSRQVLELRKKVLGPEHPHTLSSMHELGAVLNDQGKYVDAEQILKQTLELSKKVLGPEHPDTLASMHELGVVLRLQATMSEPR